MNGRSTSGTTGLGTVEVSGLRRAPPPPTRITACMSPRSRSSDALVGQAGGDHRGRIERVAPVDEQRAVHGVGHLAEVELLELVKIIDEPSHVGACKAA